MSLCQIHNVAFGGEGVGRIDNFVLFIPFTLPGELIEASIGERKKNFAHGTLLKILEKSPDRVAPPCSYFSHCGGCQLQHASYPLQLEIKRRFIEDSLLRIGKITFPVPPVTPSSIPLGYRRHISLKIVPLKGSLKLGFTAVDGHSFTPVSSCLLLSSIEDPILLQLESALSIFNSELFPPKSTLKIIRNSPYKYIAAFSFSKSLPENELTEFRKKLESLDLLEGFILKSPEALLEWGVCQPSFSYKNMVFLYSPFGFVQNHSEQSAKIYDWISEVNKDSQKVLDLYSGIGVSSLTLAKEVKEVIGVELNSISTELAKINAKNNQIDQVQFFCASAEDSTHKIIQSMNPDTIIVNPPKAGIDQEVLRSICLSSACRLTYISCSPPSLARDLALLLKEGFEIQELQCFDMFPQTTHVEIAVQMIRIRFD